MCTITCMTMLYMYYALQVYFLNKCGALQKLLQVIGNAQFLLHPG